MIAGSSRPKLKINREDFETPSDQDDTVAGRLIPGEV